LEGFISAVKPRNTSSDQLIIDDSWSLGDASNNDVNCSSEEISASAVYNGDVTTSGKCGSDGCIDTCNSGYCTACFSGNYPIPLDW